ncbi:tetratricopeptide repeat protein [Acrasis kona]|uniref:Tetratricopeptide repeat protein n=1 Tax=Acrasis kona TaxID=1008807 RepID=A0AAW2ZJT3_9EUKA
MEVNMSQPGMTDEDTQRMIDEMEEEYDRYNESLTQEQKDERYERVSKLYDNDNPLFWTEMKDENNPTIKALQALVYDDEPNEVARNFKDQGNKLLQQHKGTTRYHADIKKYYDQGLEQDITDNVLLAQLLSNRSHINILMGNYGYAIKDARRCLQVDPKNVKAMYRIAKASSMLNRWKLCLQYSEKALRLDPENKEIKTMKDKANAAIVKLFQEQEKQRQILKRRKQVPKKLVDLLKSKGIIMGDSEMDSKYFAQLTTMQDSADTNNDTGMHIDPETQELSLRVLFAYPEFDQTDCVQSFREYDTFYEHLELMFPPKGQPIPWGNAKSKQQYVLPKLRLFYYDQSTATKYKDRFVEFKMDNTLQQVMTQKDYRLPGSLMPVFYVLHDESVYLERWEINK